MSMSKQGIILGMMMIFQPTKANFNATSADKKIETHQTCMQMKMHIVDIQKSK
jgi:hypothetical protein